MKIRYDEPSIRISIIITDRERIYRWGRTHRSHERFSRRKWKRSWGYRRSVGCITATNDGLPDKPESTRLRAAPLGVLKSVSGLCSLAHACIGEFHSLDSDRAAIC
jgi:hypothetical protein